MNHIFRRGIALALIIFCATVALAEPRYPTGNLIANGGFENGTTGWTVAKNNGKAKVVCGGKAYNGDCAFYFKGTSANHSATLKQVYMMPASDSKMTLVADGGYWLRSLSGTSCLTSKITMFFKNPALEPKTRTETNCGTNTLQSWQQEGDGFYINTSVTEKSIKRIAVVFTHTGIGEWHIDAAKLRFTEK